MHPAGCILVAHSKSQKGFRLVGAMFDLFCGFKKPGLKKNCRFLKKQLRVLKKNYSFKPGSHYQIKFLFKSWICFEKTIWNLIEEHAYDFF